MDPRGDGTSQEDPGQGKEIVRAPILLAHLETLAAAMFGDLVKAVVDLDSMINLRPSQGNRTRSVDDPAARVAITEIVARLVHP